MAFEKEWKQILHSYDSLPYFHASDFWAGDDIYKKTLDWSDEKREKFLIRLATTAAGHTIIGIGLFRSKERV